MSDEGLDALVGRIMKKSQPDYKLIQRLAPFLSSRTLHKMVLRANDMPIDWKLVMRLAPFLDSETLTSLANRAMDGAAPNWKIISKLAPFLPGEYLDKLVLNLFPEDGEV